MDHQLNVPKIEGISLTPVRIIPTENGDVLHALKATEESFISFGEAYFSTVGYGKKKGWKKHTRMRLNVIVPVGEIGFVLYDDRPDSTTHGEFFEVTLSRKHYFRLTVDPNIWMAFYGVGIGDNMLLNIASIPHDPNEAANLPLMNDTIKYQWR